MLISHLLSWHVAESSVTKITQPKNKNKKQRAKPEFTMPCRCLINILFKYLPTAEFGLHQIPHLYSAKGLLLMLKKNTVQINSQY